ncbi:hypothetical protein JK358_38175 [Nocardia sp. 2]|uniref:Uncharacterized protein n=1 Tax=Nocardia acididurans TaxID=2802282 RepID=A0ABS1MIT4_9NOCA|nr:hypothetical protein [Nocardia acididurans]MBL1080239.1 hypothetical protein [Nocardia acididurans]
MSRSTDDRASAIQAQLLDTLGPNWGDELWKNMRLDPAAEPVDVPRLGDDEELTVTFTAELKLPRAAYERLLARAAESGADRDELLSEWVTTEANADDVDAITRDDVLRILAHRRPRSA